MDNEMKIVAACWSMYSAIRQAQSVNNYDENLCALLKIANDAMIMCGQIEKEATENDK